ncbi:hypothetical protein HOLleu_02992 [Holothuria leucospilota]|uniref:Uncharacterized protein n=1 Tax=Holothuria leucospilota TaxID=206669 RepID=A0A9Q1HLP3_HOLLE|nr:hypothetical protein HOLleu_02992 [Holothuria leucospilota]
MLITTLMTRDCIKKNSKCIDKTKAKSIAKFEDFVRSLGIDWMFFCDKKSGLFQYRDFTGPEHQQIKKAIAIRDFLQNEKHLESVEKLWTDFSNLMTAISCPEPDANAICLQAREWVLLYKDVYLCKNVTPYMHVLMNHIPEAIKLCGDLTPFSQQTTEKLNDTVTSWYFRSSNFKGITALKQVMLKQNMVEYLRPKC